MRRLKAFIRPSLVAALGKLASVLIFCAAPAAAAGADTAGTGSGDYAHKSTITGSISGSDAGRKGGDGALHWSGAGANAGQAQGSAAFPGSHPPGEGTPQAAGSGLGDDRGGKTGVRELTLGSGSAGTPFAGHADTAQGFHRMFGPGKAGGAEGSQDDRYGPYFLTGGTDEFSLTEAARAARLWQHSERVVNRADIGGACRSTAHDASPWVPAGNDADSRSTYSATKPDVGAMGMGGFGIQSTDGTASFGTSAFGNGNRFNFDGGQTVSNLHTLANGGGIASTGGNGSGSPGGTVGSFPDATSIAGSGTPVAGGVGTGTAGIRIGTAQSAIATAASAGAPSLPVNTSAKTAAAASQPAASPGPSGSIIYSGSRNVPVPLDLNGVYLNLFTGVTMVSSSLPVDWNTAPWINPFFGGVGIASDALLRPAITGANQIVNLSVGTSVNGGSNFAAGVNGSQTHVGAGAGQFQIGTPGYIGFAMQTAVAGPTFYGWLRLDIENASQGTILDWAYQSAAGIGINVGAVPEPGTAMLILSGTALFALRRHRRP